MGFCEKARAEGFDWVWMDTCCIDKSSSAELSEAINSMFQWYAQAAACYAYLSDVMAGDDPSHAESSFRESKWFTRGWTLQEMIAPAEVVFLSKDWEEIGTRRSLARVITEITSVDEAVLWDPDRRDDFSFAHRMSWAAKRTTTRVEDEAYSLLGLFHVNMPLLYGEGRNAFIRLQTEILDRSTDTTLLAWSSTVPSRLGTSSHSGLLCDNVSQFQNCTGMRKLPPDWPRNTKDGLLSTVFIEVSKSSVTLNIPLFGPLVGGGAKVKEFRQRLSPTQARTLCEHTIEFELPSESRPLSEYLDVPFHVHEYKLRTLEWRHTGIGLVAAAPCNCSTGARTSNHPACDCESFIGILMGRSESREHPFVRYHMPSVVVVELGKNLHDLHRWQLSPLIHSWQLSSLRRLPIRLFAPKPLAKVQPFLMTGPALFRKAEVSHIWSGLQLCLTYSPDTITPCRIQEPMSQLNSVSFPGGPPDVAPPCDLYLSPWPVNSLDPQLTLCRVFFSPPYDPHLGGKSSAKALAPRDTVTAIQLSRRKFMTIRIRRATGAILYWIGIEDVPPLLLARDPFASEVAEMLELNKVLKQLPRLPHAVRDEHSFEETTL